MDDYIKRKDIYNHIFALYKTADICGFDVTEELVLKSIEYAISEDVKPVARGYWKPVTCHEMYGGDPEAWYGHGDPIACHICSCCNGYPAFDDNGDEFLSDFCPDCGADMRGQ